VSLEWRLAWRNVWRNPRRTGLTVAATVFAVLLVVVFVAMAAGVHGKMIEDGVRIHSGHLQVAGAGYLEDQTLERFLVLDDRLWQAIRTTPGVIGAAPRLNGFGLLSKDAATSGVAVIGVDPEREPTVSTLPDRIEEGRFLPAGLERPIVLGEALARNLHARVGDRLLLYSIAYSLEPAYELFTVSGTIRLPEPSLERSLCLVRLRDAQDFFVYGDRVSEVALLVGSASGVKRVAEALRAGLSSASTLPYEVNTWDEVMPELRQFIFLDDAGMYIMLAILVVVVGFGILNTILMSVLERTRELGVMLALGLRPRALFRLVYAESMVLAAAGLLIGLALALPFVLVMEGHPIPLGGEVADAGALVGMEPVVTFELKPLNPIGSALTILGVAALAALYPAVKASRARPVDALRGL